METLEIKVQECIKCDVAIVGAGITGCLAARRLAAHNAKVVLLDAGPDPSHPSFLEQARKDRRRQHIQSQLSAYSERTAPFLVDDLDHPYISPHDAPFLWFRGRQIGGGLHLWGGCCPRLTEAQLIKPRDDGLPTWPISYAELEPYYNEAETALRVQVIHPSDFDCRVKQAIGREFPEASVILLPIAKLKFSELRRELAALESLAIIPNAVVYELVLSGAGDKIERIRYIDCCSRRSAEVMPSAVMLCASTLESTRILLQSASAIYPDGLGNCSGVLGKFLMDHTRGFLGGHTSFPERVRRRMRSLVFDLTPHSDFAHGIYIHREVLPGTRQYGCEARFADPECFWMSVFGEVDSAARNRVYLDSVCRDCWGLPILTIELRYSERDLARINDAIEFCASILKMPDFLNLAPKNYRRGIGTPGMSIHEVGTARMGSVRNNSFLNKFNQSWEVSNLFVTDGSAFPASAYQNPTLTMVALTLRACDVLASELGRRLSLEPLCETTTHTQSLSV